MKFPLIRIPYKFRISRLFSVTVTKSESSSSSESFKKFEVISEIYNSRLNERLKNILSSRQVSEEELRINLGLLDLNSFFQSLIASNSAQRQGHLSGLSTILQKTLDSIRDGLSDLRGEIQASGNNIHTSTRQQRLLGELQRREGALGVALGEFRTKCEAVKLRAIYSFTMGISALFLAIVIESSRKQKKDRKNEKVQVI